MNVSHWQKDLHRLQDGVWSWGGGEESEGAGGEDGQVELQGIISSGSSAIAIKLIGDLLFTSIFIYWLLPPFGNDL